MNKQNWIFTFGVGQTHAHQFVKIYGTHSEAREKMFEIFGDKWAFQYSEKEWEDWCKRAPSYIPKSTELYIKGLSAD
jgi:hypothetical protein